MYLLTKLAALALWRWPLRMSAMMESSAGGDKRETIIPAIKEPKEKVKKMRTRHKGATIFQHVPSVLGREAEV